MDSGIAADLPVQGAFDESVVAEPARFEFLALRLITPLESHADSAIRRRALLMHAETLTEIPARAAFLARLLRLDVTSQVSGVIFPNLPVFTPIF